MLQARCVALHWASCRGHEWLIVTVEVLPDIILAVRHEPLSGMPGADTESSQVDARDAALLQMKDFRSHLLEKLEDKGWCGKSYVTSETLSFGGKFRWKMCLVQGGCSCDGVVGTEGNGSVSLSAA